MLSTAPLIFVASVPLAVLGSLFVWSFRRRFLLRTIIVGATFIHELLLIVFPIWYSAFTDFSAEGLMLAQVSSDNLFTVMVGESVFLVTFALAFVFGWPRSRLFISQTNVAVSKLRIGQRSTRLTLNVLIVFGVIFYIQMIMAVLGYSDGLSGSRVLVWIGGFFWFTPLVACSVVLLKPKLLFSNPFKFLLAMLPLLALILVGLLGGVRGRLLWVLSLLIIGGFLNKRTAVIWCGLVISICLIPVFSFLGGDYRGIVTGGTSKTELISVLIDEGSRNLGSSVGDVVDGFAYAFAVRAQGPRNSAVLFQDHDRGGGGFFTYLGSFVFLIPSGIWPEKPVPGSEDGSGFGASIYKVMELSYGEKGSMGPLLASAQAYWEGGWIWLVIAGFVTGLVWRGIFGICRRLPPDLAAVFSLSFAAALLVDGLLSMLVPLYSIVLVLSQSIFPLIIILLAIRLFSKDNFVRFCSLGRNS